MGDRRPGRRHGGRRARHRRAGLHHRGPLPPVPTPTLPRRLPHPLTLDQVEALLAAFAVLLPWLGWILAGALLFWCITRAFGAPHPVFDILVALFVSSLAYLGFAVALGLTLPSGILGGGF